MRPQNQIWCGTPMESNCKATTNVSHDQRCAYLSQFHFNSSSTRTPPASRDSRSPIHVGVALPKQMRPLTCIMLLSSAVMHPRAPTGVRGGTTPGFSQIAIRGLLSSTGVALASNRYPYPQQDRSKTISTNWKGIPLAGLHYSATKDGARAHTAAANRRIGNPNNVRTNAGQLQN